MQKRGRGYLMSDHHKPHPVAELAATLGTIPYEVLTNIAGRVKRVYVRG